MAQRPDDARPRCGRLRWMQTGSGIGQPPSGIAWRERRCEFQVVGAKDFTMLENVPAWLRASRKSHCRARPLPMARVFLSASPPMARAYRRLWSGATYRTVLQRWRWCSRIPTLQPRIRLSMPSSGASPPMPDGSRKARSRLRPRRARSGATAILRKAGCRPIRRRAMAATIMFSSSSRYRRFPNSVTHRDEARCKKALADNVLGVGLLVGTYSRGEPAEIISAEAGIAPA